MGGHFLTAVRAAALLSGFLATLALSAPANAAYTFTSSTGNSIVPGTTDTGNHADDGSTLVALPFGVEFYGTVYNSVSVVSNGSLQFVNTGNAAFTNAALPANNFGPSMFPFLDDLRTDNQSFVGCNAFPSQLCGIFTSVSGTGPNRIFNIEWRSVYFADNSASANFEVRLYEGETFFDFIYGELDLGTASATVGVQDAFGSGEFTEYSFNTTGTLRSGQGLRWDVSASTVPEPATLALLGIGLAGLAAHRIRRRKN